MAGWLICRSLCLAEALAPARGGVTGLVLEKPEAHSFAGKLVPPLTPVVTSAGGGGEMPPLLKPMGRTSWQTRKWYSSSQIIWGKLQEGTSVPPPAGINGSWSCAGVALGFRENLKDQAFEGSGRLL